jgi:hypothetical protein
MNQQDVLVSGTMILMGSIIDRYSMVETYLKATHLLILAQDQNQQSARTLFGGYRTDSRKISNNFLYIDPDCMTVATLEVLFDLKQFFNTKTENYII